MATKKKNDTTPIAFTWDEVLQVRSDKMLDPAFKISMLERSGEVCQLRADLDSNDRKAVRKEVTAAIKSGQLVPPITVARIRDGRQNWWEVVSGANRVDAARDADQSTIRAYVLPGEYTPQQATLLAAGTNNGRIAKLTKGDKDFALYKIASAVADLSWEANDDPKKPAIIKGTMPDGQPMSFRILSNMTGCGSAAISHTQFVNVLCRKSTKAVHRWMVTHEEDGSITLLNPKDYDPEKDESILERKAKAFKKDAATAAQRAAENAAAASTAADQIAANRFAKKADIETANRRAMEAAEAADEAAEAAEAAERARNPEKIKEHRDLAVKAETNSRHAATDSNKDLKAVKARKKGEEQEEAAQEEPLPDGARNVFFTIYPKDQVKTLDGLIAAVVDCFDDKADANAFLAELGATMADKLVAKTEAA
jgi:hypothetical protein